MKINKIIITLDEKIFLEGCKILGMNNIQTNENIIFGEKDISIEGGDETQLIIVYGIDPSKVTEYITSHYIHVEKLIIANSAKIISNPELQQGDVIIPNTIIGENENTLFLEETIGNDYDLNNFGLILNGIVSSVDPEKSENNNENDFIADVYSENIFTYVKLFEGDEKIIQTVVILQVGNNDSYKNLISICDMSL